MSASSLVAQGYTGYRGWGDTEADYDFAATGGAGKGGPSSGGNSSSNGGYQPISAPDLAKIRGQISDLLGTQPTAANPHPYYYELAKQAQGDFNTAVKLMQADYSTGTKKAKEDYALAKSQGVGDLQGALGTLGLNFNAENEKTLNDLNQRGAAVYQNNPDGTPNVVTPGTFNPTFDVDNQTYNAGVSGTNPNMANLGRGGYEAEQLRQDQQLRAEAAMRAGMKPLQAAGLNLKQQTNAPAGFNINDPKTYPTTQEGLNGLGSSELAAVKAYQNAVSGYNTQSANLANQRSTDINNLSSTFANTSTKALDENAQNQIQKQYNTDFVQSGLT